MLDALYQFFIVEEWWVPYLISSLFAMMYCGAKMLEARDDWKSALETLRARDPLYNEEYLLNMIKQSAREIIMYRRRIPVMLVWPLYLVFRLVIFLGRTVAPVVFRESMKLGDRIRAVRDENHAIKAHARGEL